MSRSDGFAAACRQPLREHCERGGVAGMDERGLRASKVDNAEPLLSSREHLRSYATHALDRVGSTVSRACRAQNGTFGRAARAVV